MSSHHAEFRHVADCWTASKSVRVYICLIELLALNKNVFAIAQEQLW